MVSIRESFKTKHMLINVTVKYGVVRSVTTEVEEGTTVGQLIDEVRSALKLGSGQYRAIANASALENGNTVSDGDVIKLEPLCMEKASDELVTVTVRYGLSRTATLEVAAGSTIGDALNEARPALKFGSNVRATINGADQDMSITVRDGDIITVENSANSKAV
tara:strand:- start:45 stop:533 length:489 start_codon:yes stop_codon:yes gene_type:complete